MWWYLNTISRPYQKYLDEDVYMNTTTLEIKTETDLTKTAVRRPQLTEDGPANILIVDDDVDSALLVRSIFGRLGCDTTCSLTAKDARKRIAAGKSDLIILDWRLDQQWDAGVLLQVIAERLDRIGAPPGTRRRSKIVTYSSLGAAQIGTFDSQYFEHVEHWQKPLKQRDLLSSALGLLQRVGR